MKKEIRTILKNRTIAMSMAPEQKRVSTANIEIIVFTLAGETYGIESAFPVIDLKKFLDLPEKGLNEHKKVIILSKEQMEFGIVADVVEGIQTFALEDILETTPTLTEIGKKYLKGVTKEHIVVLEAERILNDKKIIVNEDVI
jgi:purine-binding chemotaxis protein CheW